MAPEVVAILCLAAIVRLVLLGAQSGWLDEAFTLLEVEAGWRGLVLTHIDGLHPLLYFLLLRAWLLVTGFGLLHARLFSTLCDLATVIVLYSLARRLFDRPTAIVTTVLFALSPVAIWYAATARMYALTELLALLAIRLLVEAVRTGRPRDWLWFGGCAGLALNVDFSAVYLVVAGVVWYLLLVARGQARLLPLLRSLVITAVFLIPVVALRAWQMRGTGLSQIDWIAAPTPASVWGTLSDLISQQAPDATAVAVVGGALLVCAVVMCGRDAYLSRRGSIYLLLACMFLTPLVLSLAISVVLHPVFITRQVLTALFGLLMLVGRTIVLLWDRSVWWRPLAGLALAALLTLNIGSLRMMATVQLTEDWQHAVPYVLGHSSGRTLVAFNPFFYSTPFFLYAGSSGSTVTVDWPPDTPPGPTFSTVWLIDVYPSAHPSLPRGWSALRLRLTDERRFANITVFRFTRR